MGFFGKLKENIEHGGVMVQLNAPASFSLGKESELPVTVTLTSGKEAQTVSNVKVEIWAESQSMAFSSGSSSSSPQVSKQIVAEVTSPEAIALAPGESKAVSVKLIMNQAEALASHLPQGEAMANVAHVLGELEKAAEVMTPNTTRYTVKATAKIDGVVLSPSAEQPIQILKPGQIGNDHFKIGIG